MNSTAQSDLSYIQSILAVSPCAAFCVDASGRIIAWNEAATELLGWTSSELLGEQVTGAIIPERHAQRLQRIFSRLLGERTDAENGSGDAGSSGEPETKRLQIPALKSCGSEIAILLKLSRVEHGPRSLVVGFCDLAMTSSVRLKGRRTEPRQPSESNLAQQALMKAATARDFEEAVSICLRTICEITGSSLGHAWIPAPGGESLVPTDVWFVEEAVEASPLRQATNRLTLRKNEGLPGRVWELRQMEWICEIAGTDDGTGRRQTASALGIQGVFALPVMAQNQVLCVLEFFSLGEISPDAPFLLLVSTMANELGRIIERRRWEQERTRLAAIVDSTPDAIISVSKTGVIQSWNEGARRLYGHSVEEALGEPVSLIRAGELDPEELAAVRSVLLGVRITHLECRRKHRNGRVIDVAVTFSPIRIRSGEIEGYASIEHDISALKRAQRELEKREDRIRLLLDSTGEAIYGVDLEGKCTFANRACASMLGYTDPDELLGRDMHQLMHHSRPDGRPHPRESCLILQSFITGENIHSREEVFWRKDGTQFPAEFWSYPIQRDGVIEGAVVVFDDTTFTREIEEQQGRLAAIVDSCYDAIIGKALDGTITSWNRGAEYVYGYTADEAIGRHSSLLIPEAVQQREEPEIAEASRQGHSLRQFETVRRRKDGKLINVSITVSPIRNSSGRIIGTATIERDVTERKREEQELREAKNLAEQANKTKTDFVANISHELRTPMNAIIGMIELALRDEDLSPSVRDYLETAFDSSHLMLSLVNDLLDFSRLEAGHFELDEVEFPLRHTVDESMRALSLRANDQGLELAYHVAPDVPDSLRGDPRRLRQIIMNLVGNAVKFTQEGEVTAWVTVHKREADRVQLKFSVSDTGIGIARENMEKIFQPFIQVDTSTTRHYAGAGLGLTICRELVHQMNGEIWVDSQHNIGTTVHCTPEFEIADVPSQLYVPEDLQAQLQGTRVLVVDDNATNRRILTETLGQWGMQVDCVSEGEKALARLREARRNQRSYKFLMVDAVMPEMDGVSLIRKIRETGHSPEVTVLMLSSANRYSLEKQCRELGVAAFLEKPIAQAELFRALVPSLQPMSHRERYVKPAPPTPSPLRVLVAEDTPANQKVIQAILETRGHSVDLVKNGEQALEQVRRIEYDAVLMDVQMPTMDGLQATRLIRRMEDARRADVPIIALTAHAMRGDRKRCIDAGMNEYLAKPFDAQQMIQLVEKCGRTGRPDSPSTADASSRQEEPGSQEEPMHHPPAAASAAINPRAALERLGGDEQLLQEMARFFIEDIPPLLRELDSALDSGDSEQAARAAHSIKGLASNFDAEPVVVVAREMERCGSNGDLQHLGASLPALREQVERTIEALQAQVLNRQG